MVKNLPRIQETGVQSLGQEDPLQKGMAAGWCTTRWHWASQVVLVVKNLPVNAGDIRDVGLIPGLGRSFGERHGNPLQYSCPENHVDRGAWQTSVHRVANSQTRLKQISTQKENKCSAQPTLFYSLGTVSNSVI